MDKRTKAQLIEEMGQLAQHHSQAQAENQALLEEIARMKEMLDDQNAHRRRMETELATARSALDIERKNHDAMESHLHERLTQATTRVRTTMFVWVVGAVGVGMVLGILLGGM